jgi:hypothetical protein
MKLDFTKPLQRVDGAEVKHVYTGSALSAYRHLVVINPDTALEFSSWITDEGVSSKNNSLVINTERQSFTGRLDFDPRYDNKVEALLYPKNLPLEIAGHNIKATFEGERLVAVELIK